MKKNLIYSFLSICVCAGLYAQEQVFEMKNAFIDPKNKTNESFALSDQQNGDLMVVLSGRTILQGVLLDKNYKEKRRVMAKALPSKYQYLLGYSITDGIYSILVSNKLNSRFAIIQFNTKNGMFLEKKLKFRLGNERFLDCIVNNNRIHLFTIQRNSSKIFIYTFDKDFNSRRNSIELNELEIALNKDNKKNMSLYHHFFNTSGSIPHIDLSKIDTSYPNIIEVTSSKKKLYLGNDKVYLTFDEDLISTKIASIDLKNYSVIYKSIDKPIGRKKDYSDSNSFIYEDKIFLVASSQEALEFQIKYLDNGVLIKKLFVSSDETIHFKNSPIIQEGGGINRIIPSIHPDRTVEVKNTAKFLRKISIGSLGISVFKNKHLYHIVLGGSKEIKNNALTIISSVAAFTPLGPTIQLAQVGNLSINLGMGIYNPVLFGYNAYHNTKSTYVNCLFDKDFEHVEGDTPSNSYDNARFFENSLDDPKATNIFMHNNMLHYNYFDPKLEKFQLFKFE